MYKSRIVRNINLALWFMTLSACATLNPNDPHQMPSEYRSTLSSGLFSLPHGAESVDWAIVNNSTSVQQFRITEYQFDVSKKVPVEPGPITNTVKPLHVFHNANSVGSQKPFTNGRDYEVVLEINSLKVLPSKVGNSQVRRA